MQKCHSLTTQLQQTSTRKANILQPGTAYSVSYLSNIVYIFVISLDLDTEKTGANQLILEQTSLLSSLLKRRPRPLSCCIHHLFW